MSHSTAHHAIVIGGGMAGMLAARALAPHFGRVTIMERDTPAPGQFRGGTPQARHPHLLLARSRAITEELFPGLGAELAAKGAPSFDFGERAQLHFAGGPAPATETGIVIQSISRPVLEDTVRARILQLPGVEYRSGAVVSGLLMNPGKTQVTGVTTREHGARSPAPESEVSADLVVEASGRNTHLPDWLARHGLSRPQATVVDAQLAYTTRLYDIPDGVDFDWDLLVEFTQAPSQSRGCFALRIEESRLLCTLQGNAGDHPPRDEEGYTQFAKSLRSNLSELLDQLTPGSAIYRYGATANRRYDYHRMGDWPAGLVAVGDAVCAFNPVYAQGITVAAQEALLLDELLRTRGTQAPAAALRAFPRRQHELIRWPWLWSTFGDRAWLTGWPQAHNWIIRILLNTYTDSVPGHRAQYVGFLRLAHMLSGPASLLRPHTITAIARSLIRH